MLGDPHKGVITRAKLKDHEVMIYWIEPRNVDEALKDER